MRLIAAELERCRSDFRYAASNYFWISDKEGNDRLFELWDGQELVLQKLEDMKKRGKPQRICLIKARQLGLSLLGCGIVAWVCMFRSNRRGMIVSEDEDQSQNLFNSYLSPIYRQLPWWLRPKNSSFKLDTGIVLDVPAKEGGLGLNSLIRVQWANRKGGLGQGYRLNAFHGSEFTSWNNLQGTLEEDLKYALVNSPETIAILESTAKGAGTESHSFYKKCVNLGDKADWEAVFLPYFFEKKRVLAPPSGWRVGEEESRMREIVHANWARCSNAVCGRYFNRKDGQGVVDGKECPSCESGTLSPYNLTDNQIYFIVNEKINASNTKSIRQELALTAEEAFIAQGEQVFSEKAIENIEYYVERASKPLKGFFDRVLAPGVAFDLAETGRVSPGLRHVRSIAIVTAAEPPGHFPQRSTRYLARAFGKSLRRATGWRTRTLICWAGPGQAAMTDEKRAQFLHRTRERLAALR